MLRHAEVADGIRHIGFAAWQGCQQLQIVRLPPSVVCLGEGAFQSCYLLREITAPGCLALSMVAALQSGRSTLAIAGVFGAGKTRSLTYLLAWFALTTNLRFGVAHKENPAGRAITRLLDTLDLTADQQTLFVRPVGREEAAANTASTKFDQQIFHCAGLIPGSRVVVTTTGLIWEQKGQSHSALKAHMEGLDVLICEEAQQDMDLKSAFVPAVPRQPFFSPPARRPTTKPGRSC